MPAVKEGSSEIIFGVNPVKEALQAGKRPIRRLLVQEGAERPAIRDIIRLARAAGIRVDLMGRRAFSSHCPVHAAQGVAAELLVKEPLPLDDLIERSRSGAEAPLLMVLDGVEDPRNLGAVIRTAECCGVHGLIIPNRRAAGVGGTAAKTSAGAVEFVDFSSVTNIRQTLDLLKEEGFFVVGADADAPRDVWQEDLKGPVALVLGGEDRGVRPLVRAACDALVRLPRVGQIGSLNVSVAAGMLLYEVRRQRSAC